MKSAAARRATPLPGVRGVGATSPPRGDRRAEDDRAKPHPSSRPRTGRLPATEAGTRCAGIAWRRKRARAALRRRGRRARGIERAAPRAPRPDVRSGTGVRAPPRARARWRSRGWRTRTERAGAAGARRRTTLEARATRWGCWLLGARSSWRLRRSEDLVPKGEPRPPPGSNRRGDLGSTRDAGVKRGGRARRAEHRRAPAANATRRPRHAAGADSAGPVDEAREAATAARARASSRARTTSGAGRTRRPCSMISSTCCSSSRSASFIA